MFIYKMLKNTVERGMPQLAIWRMRIACWITKTASTNSEYVMLNSFPLQQCMHERASMLRYSVFSCVDVRRFALYCDMRWAHRTSPGEM